MEKDIREIKFIRSSICAGNCYSPDPDMSNDEVHDEIIAIVKDMSPRQIAHINIGAFVFMNSFLLARNGIKDICYPTGRKMPVSKQLLNCMNAHGQLNELRHGRYSDLTETEVSPVAKWLGFSATPAC